MHYYNSQHSRETNSQYQQSISGKERLASPRLTKQLQLIRSLTALPENHFETLYLKPIEHFLAFTQHIPIALIEERFRFIIRSLKRRRAILLPANADTETVTKQKDLWTYVVFTAALIHRLTQLVSFNIVFQQSDDKAFKQWNPFTGPIPPGSTFLIQDSQKLPDEMAYLLITNILEPPCLAWFFENNLALTTLLQIMNTTGANNATSHLIFGILRSDNALENGDGSELAKRELPTQEKASAENETRPQANTLAGGFAKWLATTFKNKPETLNKCYQQTLGGPAFFVPQIFELYVTSIGEGNAQSIQAQFLKTYKTVTKLKAIQIPGIGKAKAILMPQLNDKIDPLNL